MTESSSVPIASFHLVRYGTARAMRHMAFDRPVLRGTAGLTFWKLLGTGRGGSMSPGADLRRWALLAVWRGEADLERFLRGSPIAARWRGEASESWHVRLAPLASRGTWGGRDPFGVRPARSDGEGPVAVLTRASIRPRRLVAFYRSVPPVEGLLRGRDGCLASVGMGEWPVGRQATFSLWRDHEAMRGFAYGDNAHLRVTERVRADDWYGEQLFARFAPYAAEGTWNGVNPL